MRAWNNEGGLLPAAPIVAWILEQKEKRGTLTAVAEACGSSEARLRGVLRQSQVTFDFVDQLLTEEGSTRIDEIYDLSGWDEAA